MNAPLFTPADRAAHERRKADWGESGPSFAIAADRALKQSPLVDINVMRQTIILNHKNFVPVNQTQQQKKRTFVEPYP